MKAFLVFPTQLFEDTTPISNADRIFIIEHALYFTQYKFHKQKIIFHRASMQYYSGYLIGKNYKVTYVNSYDEEYQTHALVSMLLRLGYTQIELYHPNDNWLEKQLKTECGKQNLNLNFLNSPGFINSKSADLSLLGTKKPYFQTKFYIDQRKKLNLLLEANQHPIGGKWSFDAENRKRIPKNLELPKLDFPCQNSFIKEAVYYTEKYFPNNLGGIDAPFGEELHSLNYPVTFDESKIALQNFIQDKLQFFGDYEDAIVKNESVLFHSVLSPLINVGLLTPLFVVERIVEAFEIQNIPINNIEGFIRQIIGWREFIQLIYQKCGTEQRTKNFWNFEHPMPEAFYTGETGILPIDDTIKKLLKTGYNHHIERLMILGNFMLLCEIHPNSVYQWFMELYIDAYDWVMVPNIYGMSQFSDGGIMTTKPYISGSNYILKMSDYPKGEWQEIWDGLFWRFLSKNTVVFSKNPRWMMLIKSWEKMDEAKKNAHLSNAENFLIKLHEKRNN
jgi:deoxyribodipyrimidine photolyase-related protein